MSRLIPDQVQAVFFDAVGTLLHPDPPAPAVYAEVGRRHGSRLDESEIAVRFRAAFQREEELDRSAGWRTGAEREIARWRTIVGSVLFDTTNSDTCFQELWEHFSRPLAWHIEPDTGFVLFALRERGYLLGVASNYDRRLRLVATGLPEFEHFTHLAISAELQWRKPSPGFFAALCELTGLDFARILLVGDDRFNDYEGARAAGMHAILLDRQSRHLDTVRIGRLAELIEH
jgi:putative hydrolase of the HAD superfamily